MKNCNILCVDKIPQKYKKFFWGDTGNFLRTDQIAHSRLDNLYKYQFSKIWVWTAITGFENDMLNWDRLGPIGQRIFLLNNGYQSIADSGVVSSYNYLTHVTTNIELKMNYLFIGHIEGIHAMSYAHGLENMFKGEATEKINIVYNDNVVQKRLNTEVGDIGTFAEYVVHKQNQDKKAKELLIKTIIDNFIIENVKFPFSFFTTFSLNNIFDNAIQSFTLLLKMIARDELEGHVPVGKYVIKNLRKDNTHEMVDVYEQVKPWIIEQLNRVEKEEKEWADYLLQEGSLPGFNKEMCYYFIEYRIDDTLKVCGLPLKYNHQATDFIRWFDQYRRIGDQNSSLQEVSNNNYEKGVLNLDIEENIEELQKMYIKI